MAEPKSIDISVVVPTYNRKRLLEECLDSLLRQEVPGHAFEIVVVDDGSTDGTDLFVEGLRERRGDIHYVRQERRGPAAARNNGAEYCRGRILAFIDDDCRACRGWLQGMLLSHRAAPGAAAVGGYTIPEGGDISQDVSQFLSNSSIEVETQRGREPVFFPTCNVSIKKEAFAFNKFDTAFPFPAGEDLEFFWRLHKKGAKFVFKPDIRVIHRRTPGLAGFCRQAYLYGRGNLLVQRIHRDHVLLKEIKTGRVGFWAGTLVNLLKIPRFAYCLCLIFLRSRGHARRFPEEAAAFFYFCAHKAAYICGNVVEFCRNRPLPSEVPGLLILDITHKCNLRCRVCDIWKSADKEMDLPGRYVKKMLREARTLEIKEIAFSGGEALLRGDIIELIEYARNLGHKNVGLLSNGIAVKRHFKELEPFFRDGTLLPVLSLDSLRPELHNYVRADAGAWEGSVGALKALADLKKDCPEVKFSVISIVFERNLEELKDIYMFARDLGAAGIQFQPLLANNLRMSERKKAELWVKKENIGKLENAVAGLIEQGRRDNAFLRNSEANLGLFTKYFSGELGPQDCACLSAGRTLLVANDGHCRTCFSAYGDIRRQNLEKIISGPKIIAARERVRLCPWPCLLPCFCD
ncbi:MAG: glycosyltransferase [Candidatus Omnitrophota bacterium]|jgi:glycosyltransferase involved in cell wall biosynthesis